MRKGIWEGIYKSFGETPEGEQVFDSKKWIELSRERMAKLVDEASKEATIPSVTFYNASLLPFLVALVQDRQKEVKVLDFGGGAGNTYIPLVSGLVDSRNIEYHIVDSERSCKLGTSIFHNDERIRFHTSLPKELWDVSIVHLGSSLQYVKDWKNILSDLARYNPGYFLFTDLPAGDIPTYATVQNFYGSKIPCWFFNIEEIVRVMKSIHYELLFKASYLARILGKIQKLPQANFPRKFRLGHACTLLFSGGPND